MDHYIYSYTREQLIEFLDDVKLNVLPTEELREIAIDQILNCPDSYSEGLK